MNGYREGKAKAALLRAVDRTGEFLPLRNVLRVLGLFGARYHAWRRSQKTCSLDDRCFFRQVLLSHSPSSTQTEQT